MDRDPCSRLGACSRDAEAIKEHPFFNGLDWTKVLNKEYPVPKPEMRKLDSKIDLTKSIFIDLKHNKEGINVSKESFMENKVSGWSFIKPVV